MENVFDTLVLIKGAGDLATGVAARLYRCGFPVVMTELPRPLMVRRTVSFGEAVYETEVVVEGIRARRVDDVAAARSAIADGAIPVLVDPETRCLAELAPPVLVDAVMAKANTGTRLTDAPLVIALGPGFTAGVDCHVVVETNRGHRLGRPIYAGAAEPDTRRPGEVGGKTAERILPRAGHRRCDKLGHDRRPGGRGPGRGGRGGCDGRLPARRGCCGAWCADGTVVPVRVKIGDVDPRAEPSRIASRSRRRRWRSPAACWKPYSPARSGCSDDG